MNKEKNEQYFPAGQFQECLRTERIAGRFCGKKK